MKKFTGYKLFHIFAYAMIAQSVFAMESDGDIAEGSNEERKRVNFSKQLTEVIYTFPPNNGEVKYHCPQNVLKSQNTTIRPSALKKKSNLGKEEIEALMDDCVKRQEAIRHLSDQEIEAQDRKLIIAELAQKKQKLEAWRLALKEEEENDPRNQPDFFNFQESELDDDQNFSDEEM